MLPAIGISSSGIFSSFRLLDATAHNVANSNTDGFKRTSVAFKEAANGGVYASTSIDRKPGPAYQVNGVIYEASNVDIATEAVSLMTARHMLSVNIAAFRTADEMTESLLDTFA
ncbi:MAG TPA: flagellar basal body rod C-terminal domain-containing protein [Thermodesulfobacteriota bacterium]